MKISILNAIFVLLALFFHGCSTNSEYQTCYGKWLSYDCHEKFELCRDSYCKEKHEACLKKANEAEDNVLNKRAKDFICR